MVAKQLLIFTAFMIKLDMPLLACFESGSHSVNQAGLEPREISLLLLPQCWTKGVCHHAQLIILFKVSLTLRKKEEEEGIGIQGICGPVPCQDSCRGVTLP